MVEWMVAKMIADWAEGWEIVLAEQMVQLMAASWVLRTVAY